jgi:hydroxymethylglutaryl-CoA lyase
MTRIDLRDVTARDGLQDHPVVLTLDQKMALVDAIVRAGIRWVEATSFVNPKVVPQLADAAQLCEKLLTQHADVKVSAFAATRRGAERALTAGADEISTAVPATDGMSQANFRRTTVQMLDEARSIRALAPNMDMSATVAVAFGCPYDGPVDPSTVERLASALIDAGYRTILLGDTVGVAHPRAVGDLVTRLTASFPDATVGIHLHDPRGCGLANVVAGVQAGATLVDATLGGLGGCPFAPGAAGNVAIEDVAWALRGIGYRIDPEPARLRAAALWMRDTLGIELRSSTPQATFFEWEHDAG